MAAANAWPEAEQWPGRDPEARDDDVPEAVPAEPAAERRDIGFDNPFLDPKLAQRSEVGVPSRVQSPRLGKHGFSRR